MKTKPTLKKPTLAALSLGLLTLAGTGFAAEDTQMPVSAPTQAQPQMQTQAEDKWQFGATLPLWAPQIDGNITVGGFQQDVSVSFDKLKDHLDAAFALGLDAHKGKFGLFTSGSYLKFSGDNSGSGPGGGNASSTLKFGIVNAGLSYVIVKTEGEHPFMLAQTIGLRYWYASENLTVTGPLGGVLLNGSDHQNLVDPVVGLQASQYLTSKLHLDVGGDVGGFNISHETDMTWSVAGTAAYDFTKRFSLSAGYAALALDEKIGSGASQHGFDLIFNGVLVTAQFKF